jgi:hypothetical protein
VLLKAPKLNNPRGGSADARTIPFQFFAGSQLKPSIHARCCLEGSRAEAVQDTCRVMLKRFLGKCTLILCARSCVKGFGLAHAHTLRKVSLKEPIMYPPFK